MAEKKKALTSEDKLSNLVVILSEQDPEEAREFTREEEQFLERTMAVVNEWRHKTMMDEGRQKKSLFESMVEPLRNAITKARTAVNTDLDLGQLEPKFRQALAGARYRNLQRISKSDLAGAALDDEILKLLEELENPTREEE